MALRGHNKNRGSEGTMAIINAYIPTVTPLLFETEVATATNSRRMPCSAIRLAEPTNLLPFGQPTVQSPIS